MGSVLLRSDIKGTELPPANILIPLERELTALQLCRWQFLYNETLHQISRPLLSKLSERRQIYLIPILRKLEAAYNLGCTPLENPCRLLINSNWIYFYSAPQCSHCKRCTSYGNSVRPSVRPSHAPCYVQSFWHNTGVRQTDRRTDRQADGIVIASTALAMTALRRAVKCKSSVASFHSGLLQTVKKIT